MQLVSQDIVRALDRWHRAYQGYEKAKCEPLAAAELIQASQALAAAYEDMRVPTDQRRDVERMAAESPGA